MPFFSLVQAGIGQGNFRCKLLWLVSSYFSIPNMADCAMTTHSNAKATTPTNVTTIIEERIKKTNDCFQLALTTWPSLIPVWRTVIEHRYFDGLRQSKKFLSTWADYTITDGKRVLVDTDETDGYELSQSTLQVRLTTGTEKQQSHHKLITEHMYHINGRKKKKPVSGLCLCRGIAAHNG